MSQETESVVATINKTMQEGKMTQLAPNRVMLAEQARNTWHANPESGTPADALLDAKYWAHYAVNQSIQIRPGDRIEAYADDGSYFLELLVRDVARGGIRVAELRRKEFDKVEAAGEAIDGHLIKWQGAKLKWTVIRAADQKRLSDGHADKQQAYDWLRQHHKAFAA
jgi:hypothetical protein